MTIVQRKQREKDQFFSAVIHAAYDLLNENGFEGLTLRKLAAALSYSTTKLYYEFGDKQGLYLLLAEDICARQNAKLANLKKENDPVESLLLFTHEALCFYADEPWSAGILGAVRFEKLDPSAIPATFKIAADNYRRYVVNLNFSYLADLDKLEEGLNITRALMFGALSILHPDSDKQAKDRVIKIVDDGMRLIVAGWKSLSHHNTIENKNNERG